MPSHSVSDLISKKQYTMSKNFFKFLCLFSLVFVTPMFSACGDDDASSGEENSGGSVQPSYKLSQITGYWVEWEAWQMCRQRVSELRGTKWFEDDYLNDPVLYEGVDGFYITSDGTAYDIFLEPTTMKYNNNPVAGNKVLASWNTQEGTTVYFMNTLGGKYNYSCSVEGTTLTIGFKRNYDLLSTSEMMDDSGTTYVRISLSM